MKTIQDQIITNPEVPLQGRGEGRRGRKYGERELRQRMYERVRELRRQRLSYKEIRRRIFEEFNVTVSKSTISYWVRYIHTPYGNGLGRPKEDQRLNKLRIGSELAYVIGATLGDGCLSYDKKNYLYAITLIVKDLDFAEEFARFLAVALGKEKPYRPRWDKSHNRWYIRAHSKKLYGLLCGKDVNKVRPYVGHCDECISAFIRGLADAEGAVDKRGRIHIANTYRALIEYVAGLLARLGIHARIDEKRWKERMFVIEGRVATRRRTTFYILEISRRNDVVRFRELVGFAIARKQERLAQLRPILSRNPPFGEAAG